MPGLKYTRSKSLFGLSHLRNQFEYGVDLRQGPPGSHQPPAVRPAAAARRHAADLARDARPARSIRYTLDSPKDAAGRDIYTLNDLKALQDWVLEREFRRVPRIVDVTSIGGTVKRYEIHPDPDRLQAATASRCSSCRTPSANSNANVGGDYVIQGDVAMNVRSVGLIGGGEDPMPQVLGMKTPTRTRPTGPPTRPPTRLPSPPAPAPPRRPTPRGGEPAHPRDPQHRHHLDQQQGHPRRGRGRGRPARRRASGPASAAWSSATRRAWARSASAGRRRDAQGHDVLDADGNAGLGRRGRQGAGHRPAAQGRGVAAGPARTSKAKVEELNDTPGRLLPGVQIEPYYDRTDLINVTTETVQREPAPGHGAGDGHPAHVPEQRPQRR